MSTSVGGWGSFARLRKAPPLEGTISPTMRCSFCGKPRNETRSVVAAPNDVAICDECVRLCVEIFKEQGLT